jgi:nucleoside-diphosphate-sugar epimerase
MRVLLLGASGFLGSHIAEALDADSSIELISQSRTKIARKDRNWVALDLSTAPTRDVASLLAAISPDAIVNAAGATTGTDGELARGNIAALDSLLAALAREKRMVQMVHLGSAAEYGATPVGQLITEISPTRPTSAYGRSKLAATRLVLDAADREELRAIVLRVFNPVGRRMPADSVLGAAAARIRRALEQGSDDVALGPLDDYRDFVDARDVADAVRSALHSPEGPPPAGVLNIGRGIAVQVRDAVTLLAAVAEFDGRLVETRRGSTRSARVPWQAADISLAHNALGWEPRWTLRQALVELWSTFGAYAA